MPSVAFKDNILAHSNYAYVAYGDNIIGKLENLKIRIVKDVEYDVIIGSGGRPFGEPIVKHTKFTGSFSKGMFKTSDLDNILMLDAIGNDHAGLVVEHDNTDFSSSDLTKFIDLNKKSLVILPVSFDSFSIIFGGIVLNNYEIEVVNNKYIRISSDFIGKYITYYNKVTHEDFE